MSANPFIGDPTGAPIYLDDFRVFVTSGQASRDGAAGKWHLEGGWWGARHQQLLVAKPDSGAPVLSFDPGLRGQYAIYVSGYSPGRVHGGEQEAHAVYIRLAGEPHFTNVQPERGEPSHQEIYFKTADLTGARIELGAFSKTSMVGHIKLVPVNRPPLPPVTGRTIGILDFADDADLSEPPGFEAASAIRRHAEAGYDMVMWKAYAVRCEYHTKVGEQRTITYSDAEIAKRAAGEAIDPARGMRGVGGLLQKYDTMRQAVDEAKKLKLPIFGWARINNEFSKPNHQFSATTQFHKDHAEMVQRYRDGSPAPRLSFAYEEVRQHKREILCEIAGYGMDGILIDILRHPPMALFDAPLVEAYQRRTGRDPRTMENDGDESWLRFRCEPFNQFLRETREALDKQAGRRYPLWIRTMDQPFRNLVAACDVETWLAEGLVDGIIFGPHIATGDNYPDAIDLQSYLKLAKGKAQVFGQVWRMGAATQAEALAADLYRQGVDGVALYESNLTVTLTALRERLWRFGRPGSFRG
jgi:hypothetical protein